MRNTTFFAWTHPQKLERSQCEKGDIIWEKDSILRASHHSVQTCNWYFWLLDAQSCTLIPLSDILNYVGHSRGQNVGRDEGSDSREQTGNVSWDVFSSRSVNCGLFRVWLRGGGPMGVGQVCGQRTLWQDVGFSSVSRLLLHCSESEGD